MMKFKDFDWPNEFSGQKENEHAPFKMIILHDLFNVDKPHAPSCSLNCAFLMSARCVLKWS